MNLERGERDRQARRRLRNVAEYREALADVASLLDNVGVARLLADVTPPGSWIQDAACRGESVEIFFPEGQGADVRAAKAICERCPVVEPCRDYAVDFSEPAGLWGGLGPRQRQQERRRRRFELRSA